MRLFLTLFIAAQAVLFIRAQQMRTADGSMDYCLDPEGNDATPMRLRRRGIKSLLCGGKKSMVTVGSDEDLSARDDPYYGLSGADRVTLEKARAHATAINQKLGVPSMKFTDEELWAELEAEDTGKKADMDLDRMIQRMAKSNGGELSNDDIDSLIELMQLEGRPHPRDVEQIATRLDKMAKTGKVRNGRQVAMRIRDTFSMDEAKLYDAIEEYDKQMGFADLDDALLEELSLGA